MAASTSVLAPTNNTNANFRLWGAAVDAAFLAAGWVQTADTGQINWTTVTAPGGANTAQGYSIWGTNDGLTAIYCKIEYGSGASAATPAIWLTLGTGTNGSGTLTGQVSTRRQISSGSSTTTLYNCHFAGGTGWFNCGMFMQTTSGTSYAIGFSLERILDSTGTATSTGMTKMSIGAGSAAHQTLPISGTIWSADGFIPTAFTRNATLADGISFGTIPVFPQTQISYPAMLALVGYYYTDIPSSTTFTLSRYGSNRTYIACRPTSSTPTMFGGGGQSGHAWALRYE